MDKWWLAIGFYQNHAVAEKVLKKVRRQGLRSAQIYSGSQVYHWYNLLFPWVLGLILGLFTALGSWLTLPLLYSILIGILVFIGSGLLIRYLRGSIDEKVILRFKQWVIGDEALVIVQIKSKDIPRILGYLRQVEGGHPISFLLPADDFSSLHIPESFHLTREPLTLEALGEKAEKLAHDQVNINDRPSRKQVLLTRLKKSQQILRNVQQNVEKTDYIEQTKTQSAEWLLDNSYVIQGAIEEIQKNLPKKFYNELPVLTEGPLKGLPRIYGIAVDLVENTASAVNKENVTIYLKHYQKITPLTMGELWALSMILRLRLVERIQLLAVNIDSRLQESEWASFWGNRLLMASKREPERLPEFLNDLKEEYPYPSSHFVEELLDHLFDDQVVQPMVRDWFEEHFKTKVKDIVHQEQMKKTEEQVTFSNAIMSLITFSRLSWKDIFEAVSLVDEVLKEDPTKTYSHMDFSTRDAYRHSIEVLARRSGRKELDVARQTMDLASQGRDEVERHVGYYLLDYGRPILEKKVGYRPKLVQRIRRAMILHPSLTYLGGLFLLTAIFEAVSVCVTLQYHPPLWEAVFFSLLALWPISEISVQFINFLLTQILHPFILPKMIFEKGIPEEYRTLVVVPTLLSSRESVQGDLEHLEIRYLANDDPALRFSLFTDYLDAPQEKMPNDEELLNKARLGIEELNKKYGEGTFFLFHRPRVWSQSEKVWMGWERKRGKLEALNRYLLGEPENILQVGHAEALKNIPFVITLDADTQLPKDKAKCLIEAITHPLNKPRLGSDDHSVVRGYTIIQPRVSTQFFQPNETRFSKIFSDIMGLDPYTQAISDVYQDLAREGTYHGKGIYNVEAFQKVLANRFPAERILSHDLIEGAFVHVGFASDINLFDNFPQTYKSWSQRLHRWMRGDWQIAEWLLPNIPTANGRTEPNPLSPINRWKIFDNLRRALMPVFILALLLSGWLISSTPMLWTLLALTALFFPSIALYMYNLITHPKNALGVWDVFLNNIYRTLFLIALLPHQAYLSVDAKIRSLYRRFISHHSLLEWTQSKQTNNHSKSDLGLIFVSLFAIVVYASIWYLNPPSAIIAAPFCLLWLLSPIITGILNRPINKEIDRNISEDDKGYLRCIGRKTWRFFDDFVGPQTHWLPPDNYQAALEVEVAMRTSPTNIGLWLLSALTAYDFKYISADDFIDRALATMKTLKELEHYEGHLLNWFDIQTVRPLYPRYVSTVDSGNFIACLWTLEEGIYQLLNSPILPFSIIQGLTDTLDIALPEERKNLVVQKKLHEIKSIIQVRPTNILELITTLRLLRDKIHNFKAEEGHHYYWVEKLTQQIDAWNNTIDHYLLWIELLGKYNPQQLIVISPEAPQWREKLLNMHPSMECLLSKTLPQELVHLFEQGQRQEIPEDMRNWIANLKETYEKTQLKANERFQQVSELLHSVNQEAEQINMKFLYDVDRNVFTIGYNVDKQVKDNSFYDLLASEARIASLVSIAKGDAPLKHWWSLGRPYTIVNGRRVLLSWGGTMFEYLMPLIFNRGYSDSLIGDACQAAVACQIDYGNKRGIPWGISESAFSEIDQRKIYQYRSFGVPGMGLKRGLEEDLVVSPYSTGLALMVDPVNAVQNFKILEKETRNSLFSTYGFYESIDFSRQQGPKGERGVIIYAYMAHHQGMILNSINNVLNNDVMAERFQADHRVAGVNFLIYERIPLSPNIVTGYRKDIPIAKLSSFSTTPILGVVHTPYSPTPKANLLSNGTYSIMTTNAGGGYSKWKDFDISRWRSDTTTDQWGNFYYIRDLDNGGLWSTAYQPTQSRGRIYTASFKADSTEFRRREHHIETITEIVVSPEDDAEIQLITLVNLTKKTRHIELTSYIELALAPHNADQAHPCFNKMFIQTQSVPKFSGLLAFRRPRSPDDAPIFAAHTVAVEREPIIPLQFETDRSLFIGRDHTTQRPAAIYQKLSNTEGTVLDPIFSLRVQVTLEPGERKQISFVTVAADNRDKALSLIEKYSNLHASHRAKEMSWTHTQLELRHLRLHQEEVQLFQKLASRILYPHLQLRCSSDRIRRNRYGQSQLWAHGISGDLPIIVVTIGSVHEVDLVKQTIMAQTFFRMRGLKVDLLILNEEATGYDQPLSVELQRVIYSQPNVELNKPGGVYLRSTDKLSEEDLNLLLSAARVILVSARGSLRQQLVSPIVKAYPPLLQPNKFVKEEPSRPLGFFELSHFNGLGGFTLDGKEYVIFLPADKSTPAPWINVIANEQFGSIVTESGLGTTWFGNSQTNRLTPWSNDPVLNPIVDTIYIRDNDLGSFWTPTPSPIRELDPYRIRHGQGYSIFEHSSHSLEQELLIFVPMDEKGGLPIRIQRLRIQNTSSRSRKLNVTSYTEWVLGTNREDNQMHIFTEWDPESQAMFARNSFNPSYGNSVAFAFASPSASSYTGDRTEFIGRNHSTSNPSGMRRKSLSGTVGTGLDPCSALQTFIELAPGEKKEVVFIVGYASDAEQARKLILKCKEKAVDDLFESTKKWWNGILETIQVETPDVPANFAINRWLLYQNLSCRIWGRTAFYQSSGGFGFRDQLQDVMAILYSDPKIARDQILLAASRQFIEGDVQHWWQPPTGAGVRTRISDDLLWLPYVTAQYIRVTQDFSILNEVIPFLKGPILEEHQHELFFVPEVSEDSGTLVEHCRRSISKGLTSGPHGLPLIGGGDWNDGMNRVGVLGRGESVWLAWFIIHVMNDFAEILSAVNQSGDGFVTEAKRLAEVIEEQAWDGEWYRRAYFDDGSPLGSKESLEAMIDSLAQSWAIISKAGNPERTDMALKSVEKYLIKAHEKIVLLLTPAFDKTPLDPGYIKGYPPGVRENGGQYTHGSLWVPLAFARKGNGDMAVALLRMMQAVAHSGNMEEASLYRIEPYVVAADIYSLAGQVGRGGWSWYTGSSGWMYRVWLEEVLGFKLRGNTLRISPCIPKDWDRFAITYRHKTATYSIVVENPSHISCGKTAVQLDGVQLKDDSIPLVDDGRVHNVKVIIT